MNAVRFLVLSCVHHLVRRRSTNRWCGGTIGETRTYRYAFGELQFLSASGGFVQRGFRSTRASRRGGTVDARRV